MSMYSVSIPEVHYIYVDVEANSEEDAKKAAVEMMAEGVDDLDPEYSHTLDVSEWRVEEI